VPRRRRPVPPARLAAAALLLLAACMPTSDPTTANGGAGLPPELLFCRGDADFPATAEIALRTAQNLGTARAPERSGRELQARLHPDGKRIVFTRERTPGNADTGDVYTSSTDGSVAELRLTSNAVADDHPCWSPTGDRVLFVTSRDGDRRLYIAAADGSNAQPLLAAAPGTNDDEPDWHRGIDRIVFTRREPNGLRHLMLVNGDGTGLVPLTTGSVTTSAEVGQHEPSFAPDGSRVLFVRVIAPVLTQLFTVDVQTGAEQILFDPAGEVRQPRFAPAGDRIFCALAQPLFGRAGLRLAALSATGTDPVLVEPGEQWRSFGIEPFPTMPPRRAAQPPEVVSLDALEVQLASGTPVSGSRNQLGAADGSSLVLATQTFQDHEIASINCVFTLPVIDPDDVLELRALMVARVTRSDANTTLRSSMHNPVQTRFDTIAEVPQPGTDFRTFGFATQSLAHVSLQRQVRVTVIGEIGAGARASLEIDQVQLTVVRAVR